MEYFYNENSEVVGHVTKVELSDEGVTCTYIPASRCADLCRRIKEAYPDTNSDTARFVLAKQSGLITNEEYDMLYKYYR